MRKPIKHLIRTLAVATAIVSLLSYLLMPAWLGRHSALANAGASSSSPSPPALQGEQAASQLKEQGLYDSLAEAVATTRYALRWEDRPALDGLPPAYRAPNLAQRLTAYFTPTELHLAPLTADGKSEPDRQTSKQAEGQAEGQAEWRATMRLIGYGYGDALLPVGASAKLAARDNRIEYHRADAPLTEWYINKADGLEQGFTIAAPPGAPSANARLRLTLEVTGDLRAELTEEGKAIALRHVNGEMALRYSDLHAYDANERELSAQMRVEDGQVILEVDDANAAYPVMIDPLITQQQKLIANEGAADDWFGASVAVSEDTAVVGAPKDDIGVNSNQGSAYVFVRNGSTWSQHQKLTASDGAADDWFGYSVAISGDRIVVGALYDDVGMSINQGSAYVFARSGTSWFFEDKLWASDGEDGDFFGVSVAISGDTAVVGAYSDNVGANSGQGSAYVFARNGSTWSQQQRLTANDGAAVDFFGTSVAISGNTVVVGAVFDDIGFNNQGSAYVFVGSGSTWSQQQKLWASDGAAGDHFGSSVAISGNTVVVGAPYDDVSANSDRGSAYMFVYDGLSWNQQQQLTASDGATYDNFGASVAISGDTAVVGAELDDMIYFNFTNFDQGSAYVFVRGVNSWSQQQKLIASDGATSDRFGHSVAISGEAVVVGALYDDNSYTNQGSAYVFATWGEQDRLTASDGAADDRFGYSVSISGNTAVVGAPYDDDAYTNQGSAYVFKRSGASWSQQQKLTAGDGAALDWFGYSVAIDGETVVVGARGADIGSNTNQGAAYVFVRSNNTWSVQQKLTASDGAAYDYFGHSVAISGDTAVVGALYDDVGINSDQGSAYVFARSNNIWSQRKLTASDGAAGARFGHSVSINGDTAVVGAPYDDVAYSNQGFNYVYIDQGSAYVFVRNNTIWSQQQKLTASDGATDDRFGYSVAISGDTAVVGAYLDDIVANSDQGSAYVFVRSGSTWNQQQRLTAGDGAGLDWFGYSVAISGETVIVGAYLDDVGVSANQGSAYVFVRNGGAWSQQQQLTGSTAWGSDYFGASVAISGSTVVVGAPNDDIGPSADQGSAYVFVRQ